MTIRQDPVTRLTPNASDAVRVAMRVAAEAARIAGTQPGCCGEGTGCEVGPCHCSAVAARAAVAAFLRALPAKFPMQRPGGETWGHSTGEMARLAALVEDAKP